MRSQSRHTTVPPFQLLGHSAQPQEHIIENTRAAVLQRSIQESGLAKACVSISLPGDATAKLLQLLAEFGRAYQSARNPMIVAQGYEPKTEMISDLGGFGSPPG